MVKLSIYGNILENFSLLKDSGILDSSRFNEVLNYLDESQFSPAQLINGRAIPKWFSHNPSGRMFSEWQMGKGANHYRNKELLEFFLTDEEKNKLNSLADGLYSEHQEKMAYERAEKINEGDYTGSVCSGDQYAESVEELLETLDIYEDDGDERPDYFWAAKQLPWIEIDANSVIENSIKDCEGSEDFKILGEKELREAIEKFNMLNSDKYVLEQDRSKVVILNKKKEEND